MRLCYALMSTDVIRFKKPKQWLRLIQENASDKSALLKQLPAQLMPNAFLHLTNAGQNVELTPNAGKPA